MLLLLAVVGLSGLGDADQCVSLGMPEVDTGETPAGRFYVDNDPCQPDCLYSIWVYQESNGIDSLQRHDEVVDNTCGGTIEPDTLIF